VVKTENEASLGGGFSDVFKGELREASGPVCVSAGQNCLIFQLLILRDQVAIKVLRGRSTEKNCIEKARRVCHYSSTSLILPELSFQRFNRESRLWHQLEHPNILPFLGISFGFGSFPALVSPLCKSGNAVDYLSTNPLANRLDIVRYSSSYGVNSSLKRYLDSQVIGIARGVEYLHDKDIVHGDLKGVRSPFPLSHGSTCSDLVCQHNVLIDDNCIPRLSDFGRSLIIDHRGFTTDFLGSARYMAPELLAPMASQKGPAGIPVTLADDFTPKLTKASDVYAFDMVALEVSASFS
jgi:serine/threonine protein kinase